MKLITKSYLNECFNYDEKNGELSWKERPQCHFSTLKGWRIFNHKFSGKKVSLAKNTGGYLGVTLDGKKYTQHRIIWMLHYGVIETGLQVDNINHDRTDNRIKNLRLVTHQENIKNLKLKNTNTSGYIGVTRHGKRWKAQIQAPQGRKHIGCYDTPHDAHQAYEMEKKKYGFHKNHGVAQ
ncbi:HNH endonuclease [Xenorhabdus bovienii]|uniref:Putative phage associated protein n=1 Tax=Xenorhabdus bovienii TaxID=40576 RepID=A0A0B6X903_XENBV|nr:HNH endonuclease [Xenorhabdus bovienii]CDM90060.1 Putative phage associated protein [Xenorhabdus bovienii]